MSPSDRKSMMLSSKQSAPFNGTPPSPFSVDTHTFATSKSTTANPLPSKVAATSKPSASSPSQGSRHPRRPTQQQVPYLPVAISITISTHSITIQIPQISLSQPKLDSTSLQPSTPPANA